MVCFFAFQCRACLRASQGQWVTDSLHVCGRLRLELQGQAAEGRAGDLSLRIELISLGLPQAPLSLLFLCTPSYFEGEEHFSHCLHAHTSADAVSLCLRSLYGAFTRGHVCRYNQDSLDIFGKKQSLKMFLAVLWTWQKYKSSCTSPSSTFNSVKHKSRVLFPIYSL